MPISDPFGAPSDYRPRGDWVLRPGDRAFSAVLDMITQIDLTFLALLNIWEAKNRLTDAYGSAECAQFNAEARP